VIQTEVVIVGGGLAGLSMACALGSAGVPTVCIDRDSPAAQEAAEFDLRTTAIAFGSRQVLAGAGLWAAMVDEAGPILQIRVADNHAPLFVHYDHREVGDQPLGWILENGVIRRALARRLTELPSVRHLAPAPVAAVGRDATGATVTLEDGCVIRGRLVIGADGRRSLVRQTAGIPLLVNWRYGQSAIICNIAHEYPHTGLALEHFLPGGPFAVLPMTGNRCSIVWSEQERLVPMYLGLPPAEFAAELQRRLGDWLGEIRVITQRAAYPLNFQLSERLIDRRVALISEAAHGIHPVAGQGLNLGLRDVAALAEVIVDRYRLGLDVGDPAGLERYQRWRRFDNLLLSVVCDQLVWLFSNAVPPVRLARDLGLGLVGRLPPARRFLMRHAMGVVGELPRMVRGEAL